MADLNLSDLARVAVTLPGWRWMDGMAAYWVKPSGTARGRVRAYVDGDGFSWESPRGDFTGAWPMPEGYGECLPDLSDPATFGCLLALVREAWSSPDLRVRRVGQRTLWEVERWDHAQVRYVHVADGPSEVDALVAALEVSNG